jgi:hypothetical protein
VDARFAIGWEHRAPETRGPIGRVPSRSRGSPGRVADRDVCGAVQGGEPTAAIRSVRHAADTTFLVGDAMIMRTLRLAPAHDGNVQVAQGTGTTIDQPKFVRPPEPSIRPGIRPDSTARHRPDSRELRDRPSSGADDDKRSWLGNFTQQSQSWTRIVTTA